MGSAGSGAADTPDRHEFAVAFTPSGDLLFVVEGEVAGRFDIYTRSLETGDERRLTSGEMSYNGPVSQVDSRYLVFQSGRDVWLHDLVTRLNHNLTGSEGINYSPSVADH